MGGGGASQSFSGLFLALAMVVAQFGISAMSYTNVPQEGSVSLLMRNLMVIVIIIMVIPSNDLVIISFFRSKKCSFQV